MHPSLEVAGDVGDRLARCRAPRPAGSASTRPPSSRTATSNVDARAQRRLVEQQRHVAARQRARGRRARAERTLPLQLRRQREAASSSSGVKSSTERKLRASAACRRCRRARVAGTTRGGSCPVLPVDAHVLGAQVAGPHRGLARAAGAQVDLDVDVGAPQIAQRLAAPPRRTAARPGTARPARRAPARAPGRNARPSGRPPRPGGPSSDRRRARRSSRAASWRSSAPPARRRRRSRAPVTRMATSLVAPSPPRTIISASSRHTASSPPTSAVVARARRSSTPLAPLASATTVSLVEHSPSTVMALNVSSTTSRSARCSSAGGDRRIRRHERRASSPASARSCRRPWPCRRRETRRPRSPRGRRVPSGRVGRHDGPRGRVPVPRERAAAAVDAARGTCPVAGRRR